MLVVVPLEIGEAQIEREFIRYPALQTALLRLLDRLDMAWITLAAVNTYLFVTKTEGVATGRRWAGIVILGSAALVWVGAKTGFPLGPIRFTEILGARIGGTLPIAVPLLWFVVIVNSRYVVLHFFPRVSERRLRFGIGLLALITDLNLEPVAWEMRAYWLWHPDFYAGELWWPWPPAQNYLTWFVAGITFATLLRESRVAAAYRAKPGKPMVLIFTMFNAVFAAANLVRWLRPMIENQLHGAQL